MVKQFVILPTAGDYITSGDDGVAIAHSVVVFALLLSSSPTLRT
jgi:hypothetical protein